MKGYQEEFINFALSREVLCFGDFTLKSGRKSPYFFNIGKFKNALELNKIGGFYASSIEQAKLDFDLLFGPAYKGIPLVIATANALLLNYAKNYNYSFNRKEAKDHGEGGMIVGAELAGNVLLIDDVITAGSAIGQSAPLINASAKLKYVSIALDREEVAVGSDKSAVELVQQNYNCEVISIVSMHNLIDFIAQDKKYQNYLAQMQDYRSQYGVKAK